MTILCALLILIVANLVTTITSLYDLTIQLFIGKSMSNGTGKAPVIILKQEREHWQMEIWTVL